MCKVKIIEHGINSLITFFNLIEIKKSKVKVIIPTHRCSFVCSVPTGVARSLARYRIHCFLLSPGGLRRCRAAHLATLARSWWRHKGILLRPSIDQYPYDVAVDTRVIHIYLQRPLTLTYDLDFQSPASYNCNPWTRKNQGRRLVGSEDRVEKRMHRQKDTAERITFSANDVRPPYSSEQRKRDVIDNLKQVCVQLPTSADNATVFAGCCWAPAVQHDRYLLPTGPTAANPPHAAAAVDRLDRQTDGCHTVA